MNIFISIFKFLFKAALFFLKFFIECVFSANNEPSKEEDTQYESHWENQIDVETGEVIAVETKRVGL